MMEKYVYVHNPYDFEITGIGEYFRLKNFLGVFLWLKDFFGDIFRVFHAQKNLFALSLSPSPLGTGLPIQFTT